MGPAKIFCCPARMFSWAPLWLSTGLSIRFRSISWAHGLGLLFNVRSCCSVTNYSMFNFMAVCWARALHPKHPSSCLLQLQAVASRGLKSRRGKKLQYSDRIPTNSCKFSTEEICDWVLKISILPSKWGFLTPNFAFLDYIFFRQEKGFSTILPTGQLPPG